jgi:hypothetical protein
MQEKIKVISVILGIVVLIGCASAPMNAQEATRATFPALPQNWQTMVRGYYSMPGQLKDPYSAMYRFEKPRKGFGQDGMLLGGKRHYGWVMSVWINAKNSFGGYTGYELHVALFSNEGIGDATEAFGYGHVHFIDGAK